MIQYKYEVWYFLVSETRIISPVFTYSNLYSYILHMMLVISQSGRSCPCEIFNRLFCDVKLQRNEGGMIGNGILGRMWEERVVSIRSIRTAGNCRESVSIAVPGIWLWGFQNIFIKANSYLHTRQHQVYT